MKIETWGQSVVAFVCFGWLLAVIYGLVMVFGPEVFR